MNNPFEKERWDMARIMAKHFQINGEGFDESDFEWTAHCLQCEGYHKQEWHDVATDPPKTSGSYIVCTDKGGVCTAHYYADCGRFNAPFKKSAVWWTYLPEAPQKGE